MQRSGRHHSAAAPSQPPLYLPVRFFLDTLRVADARYLGLTPAQWVAALVFASLPFAVSRHRRLRFAVGGVVVLATADGGRRSERCRAALTHPRVPAQRTTPTRVGCAS